MYLIIYAFPYLIIRADKYVFNRHFRGFIWALSGLLLVSKRASRPRFAPSVPRVFRIRLINERTAKNPDFPPLARTSINSPSKGLFVARERELEKGSSLTPLPYLFSYSPNCLSLSADLGVLGLTLRALA